MFEADARVMNEGTLFVRLKDGRGWLFEDVNGEKVLDRINIKPTPVQLLKGDHSVINANPLTRTSTVR